jgi:hypothetical protein
MGAQVSISENVAENVTEIVNNVMMKNTAQCGGENIIKQGITAQNVKGPVVIENMKLDASQDINLTCLQTSDNNLDIQSDIKAELEQMAKAKISGLNFGVGAAVSKNVMRSITKLSNTIKVDNIKSCLYTNIIDQSVNFGTIESLVLRNFDAKAIQTSVTSCIQKDRNTMTAINELETSLKQTADSSIEGLLAGPFGSIIIGIIAIVALFFVYKFFLAKSGGGGASS